MRAWISFSAGLFLLFAACTFPTVDYVDGVGGGSSSGAGCSVAGPCGSGASTCAADARTTLDCVKKCKAPDSMACATCQVDLATALDGCVTTCRACAQGPTCADASSACRSVVGSP